MFHYYFLWEDPLGITQRIIYKFNVDLIKFLQNWMQETIESGLYHLQPEWVDIYDDWENHIDDDFYNTCYTYVGIVIYGFSDQIPDITLNLLAHNLNVDLRNWLEREAIRRKLSPEYALEHYGLGWTFTKSKVQPAKSYLVIYRNVEDLANPYVESVEKARLERDNETEEEIL